MIERLVFYASLGCLGQLAWIYFEKWLRRVVAQEVGKAVRRG